MVEHPAREPLCRPRLVVPLASAGALFTLGFALTAQPPQASAGGLLPTVTLPGVTTVTLPTVATTTAPTSTTTPSSATMETLRSTAQVTGAKRLRSGPISIPVSSVRAPARFRLVLNFVPGSRATSVRARVIDTRGFVVRGARVSMRSAPIRALISGDTSAPAHDGHADDRGDRSVCARARSCVEPSSPHDPGSLLMPLDRVILVGRAQVSVHVRPMPGQRGNS
jgi:hypothetical protein